MRLEALTQELEMLSIHLPSPQQKQKKQNKTNIGYIPDRNSSHTIILMIGY